jgi:hypothetical protein
MCIEESYHTYSFKFKFTPLESPACVAGATSARRRPAACTGDEDKIPFGAHTGFKAPCERSRWKVEDLLTGFTAEMLFR